MAVRSFVRSFVRSSFLSSSFLSSSSSSLLSSFFGVEGQSFREIKDVRTGYSILEYSTVQPGKTANDWQGDDNDDDGGGGGSGVRMEPRSRFCDLRKVNTDRRVKGSSSLELPLEWAFYDWSANSSNSRA